MYLQYGNFRHSLGETTLIISRLPRKASNGDTIGYTERWDISGMVLGATQALITAGINAIESAYSQNGKNAILFLSDGTTKSAHQLLTQYAIGGVRVAQPVQFPKSDPGEYATGRSYQLALEADFGFDEGDGANNGQGQNTILQWSETLSITGDGGPKFVIRETLNTAPIAMQTRRVTKCRATQSGTAVGLTGYPPVPPPIWPQWLIHDEKTVVRSTPQQTGSGSQAQRTEYPVSWSYQFESTGPLQGYPNRRTR
jgi:hypothetical protein